MMLMMLMMTMLVCNTDENKTRIVNRNEVAGRMRMKMKIRMRMGMGMMMMMRRMRSTRGVLRGPRGAS
eukprot:9054611-Pyramimonas_sp.AAC.1